MSTNTSLNHLLLGFLLLLFASLSFAQGQTYKVVKDANVRSGPSTDFAKIGTVSKGTLLTVLGTTQSRKWYQVQMAGGVKGYIYAPLMAPAQQTALPVVQPTNKAKTVAPKAAAPVTVQKKPMLKKPAAPTAGTQTAQAAPKRLAPKRVAPQQAAPKATAPQRTLAPKTVQQPARTAAPTAKTPAPAQAPAQSAEAQIAAAITQTLVNTLVGTQQPATTAQPAQQVQKPATVVSQPGQVARVPTTPAEQYEPELLTFYCDQGVDQLFYATFEGETVFLQSADGSEYFQLAHNGADEYWDYYADQTLVFAVNFDNEAWVSDAQGNRLFDQCYGE